MTHSIVIGGGIIGMLTAWNLHNSGHRVTVIERGQTGRESSWAGGGIVSPLYPWRYHDAISSLANYGQQHYPEICRILADQTGIDPEYTENGLIIIAPEEELLAVKWSERYFPSLDLVQAKQVSQLEPGMRTSDTSAIWMPAIAQVRNPRIAKSLAKMLKNLNIDVITDTEITSFTENNGQLTGIKSVDRNFVADNYVVCSGAWTGDLLHQTGLDLAIKPVKGQMILFKGAPNDIKRIVLEEDRYIIPRRDGRILFGSTVEHSGFDKAISQSAKQELHDIAVERFPVLKDKQIEHHWAGLRPGSPDGIPVIGQHPELENLYINAGHFRNGVILGPGSCKLITSLINGQSDELNNPVFSPAGLKSS